MSSVFFGIFYLLLFCFIYYFAFLLVSLCLSSPDLDSGVEATANLAAQIDLSETVARTAGPETGLGAGAVAEVVDHVDEGDVVVAGGTL